MNHIVCKSEKGKKGKQRINQDYYSFEVMDNKLLLLLTDGLGGHPGGEKAARILVEEIASAFRERGESRSALSCGLENALEKMSSISLWMGTTFVYVLIEKAQETFKVSYSWIGDSRIYLQCREKKKEPEFLAFHQIDDKNTYLLTRDDSLVWQENEDKSDILELINRHPGRNSLLKSVIPLISRDELKNDVLSRLREITLQKEDTLLLCSDGLWELYSEHADLARAMVEGRFELDRLLAQYNRNENLSDDVTYIYLKLQSDLIEKIKSSPL